MAQPSVPRREEEITSNRTTCDRHHPGLDKSAKDAQLTPRGVLSTSSSDLDGRQGKIVPRSRKLGAALCVAQASRISCIKPFGPLHTRWNLLNTVGSFHRLVS